MLTIIHLLSLPLSLAKRGEPIPICLLEFKILINCFTINFACEICILHLSPMIREWWRLTVCVCTLFVYVEPVSSESCLWLEIFHSCVRSCFYWFFFDRSSPLVLGLRASVPIASLPYYVRHYPRALCIHDLLWLVSSSSYVTLSLAVLLSSLCVFAACARTCACTPGTVLVLLQCALSVCKRGCSEYRTHDLGRWLPLSSVVLPTALRILNVLCQKGRTNSNLFIGIYELN
jgi:hypothetical protein